MSTRATDTCASFTSSHITDRRHELTPRASGELAVQLGFWLREDAGTGKWFMLKARCNPSCRKSLDSQDSKEMRAGSSVLQPIVYLSIEIKFREIYIWNVRVYPHYNSASRPVILG